MPSTPIELHVAGQAFRVHSDADPAKLHGLAAVVDSQAKACNPNGRLTPTQALLYAALTLAERLEELARETQQFEDNTRDTLYGILHRIDAAVATTDSLCPATGEPAYSNTAPSRPPRER